PTPSAISLLVLASSMHRRRILSRSGLAMALASAAVASRLSIENILSIDFSKSRAQDRTMADAPPRSLWRTPDFLKLWTGETVSLLGSQVSVLALPLAAIAILHASNFE